MCAAQTDPQRPRAMPLSMGCPSASPRELLRLPGPRPHTRPWKSHSPEEDPQQRTLSAVQDENLCPWGLKEGALTAGCRGRGRCSANSIALYWPSCFPPNQIPTGAPVQRVQKTRPVSKTGGDWGKPCLQWLPSTFQNAEKRRPKDGGWGPGRLRQESPALEPLGLVLTA